MSFPAYPAYKDSTISWLGRVPSHWNVLRLKHACEVFPSNVDKHARDDEPPVRLCNYTDVYYNERITADMPFMEATASEEQIARFTLRGGDTIITKDSETADDIAVAAYVPDDLPGVVCGYHLSMVRPRGSTFGAFVKRLFDSVYAKARFAVAANGLTRVGLGQYAVDNIDLPFPPADEQRAIAAFLDRETAKIDALVEEQKRLIELLKEKRQAVISQAVTKGLDPSVPMKDSGVAWLGAVPAHWDLARLKFVAHVQTGVAKGKDTIGKVTIEVPYLRVANVQDGYLDLDEVSTIEIPADDLPRYRLRAGDVLMNEGGDFDKLGRGHVWDGSIDPCIHQNHVFAVRPMGISPRWLNAVTSSDYAQFFFMSRSKQSTNLASISSTNLMEFPVVIPPAVEQEALLNAIDAQCATCDRMIESGESAIQLLLERRSVLISAAVTGKIDVRALTPQ